ncbi:MAG: hypothetical protein JWM16_4497, partial [Verrucomicrobiales bacterium]|nr:hypothetical protein [Verrucomicrobiales bacterium]
LGKAVWIASGSGNLRLVSCTMVGTAPATLALDAASPTTVVLYGECVANLTKGGNVTTSGSALSVNVSLT